MCCVKRSSRRSTSWATANAFRLSCNRTSWSRMHARLGQQVAGDVFEHELIVRNIRIESADDIIAVPMREGIIDVELVSRGFGVTHEVEPVPGPALAVVW